jgi:restriction system protein
LQSVPLGIIEMAARDENILKVLAQFPWWVSVCITALVYVGLRFIVPNIQFENALLRSVAVHSPSLAWVAIIFLFPAIMSASESFRKRRLLDRQMGIESINLLSSKEFEELLAEAYRRQGYAVKENFSLGPDGGVDLWLQKGAALYLVQCKHWKDYKVGVKVVREMYGVMTAERASGVFIVTSGIFTQEAKNFATGRPIDLVEGHHLVNFIRNVQEARNKAI